MEYSVHEIADGINLNCFPGTGKEMSFISVNVLSQLSRETVSFNAVLPFVLAKGCFSRPDASAIKAAAEAAGWMSIIPFSRKFGEVQSVGIQAEFSDRYLKQALGLVCELVSNPATRGGLLLPDYVSSVCEELADKAADCEPDSIGLCINEMCAYEDYSISPSGEPEEIQSISYKKLSKHYKSLLQTAPIEIIYIGNANEKQLVSELKRGLNTIARTDIDYEIGTDIRLNSVEESPRYSETTTIEGTEKITLGYRFGEKFFDYGYAVFELMLKLAEKRLLKENKESLTSLNFFSDAVKGIFAVSAAPAVIEEHSFEEVFSAVLSATGNKEFSAEELAEAKKELQHRYHCIAADNEQLSGYILSSVLSGREPDIDEALSAIADAMPENIAAAAAGAVPDMIFEEKPDF